MESAVYVQGALERRLTAPRLPVLSVCFPGNRRQGKQNLSDGKCQLQQIWGEREEGWGGAGAGGSPHRPPRAGALAQAARGQPPWAVGRRGQEAAARTSRLVPEAAVPCPANYHIVSEVIGRRTQGRA